MCNTLFLDYSLRFLGPLAVQVLLPTEASSLNPFLECIENFYLAKTSNTIKHLPVPSLFGIINSLELTHPCDSVSFKLSYMIFKWSLFLCPPPRVRATCCSFVQPPCPHSQLCTRSSSELEITADLLFSDSDLHVEDKCRSLLPSSALVVCISVSLIIKCTQTPWILFKHRHWVCWLAWNWWFDSACLKIAWPCQSCQSRNHIFEPQNWAYWLSNFSELGQCDGSVIKSTCHQGWQLNLNIPKIHTMQRESLLL